MKINIKEYNIDFGIDPELHIAQAAGKLSEEKPLLRMRFFSTRENIACELVAKIGRAQITTENDAFACAAALLRNCYGKVNYFVAPALADPEIPAMIKTLKAYRNEIKVTVVTADKTDPAGGVSADLPDQIPLAAIDTACSVSAKHAAEACAKAKETENISLGPASGAALYAAAKLAKTIGDRHQRVVVFLPD